ncbi:MAG: XRE family transcriptional regulator [Candidatus Korobacteraceae bacterium]
MAQRWREIRKQRSPEREARIKERVAREMNRIEASLAQLRHARELTQVQLARALNVPQSTISKMEHRADVYLSTLRSYIEAMGGNLEIRAVFPDMEIVVTQFQQLEPGKKNQQEPREQVLVRA